MPIKNPETIITVILENGNGAVLQKRIKGQSDVWLKGSEKFVNAHHFRKKILKMQELLHDFPARDGVIAIQVEKENGIWNTNARKFFRK